MAVVYKEKEQQIDYKPAHHHQKEKKKEQGGGTGRARKAGASVISRQNARVFNLIRLMLHKRPGTHAQASGVTSLSCCSFFYRRVNIIRSGLCPFSFWLCILVEIKTTRKRTSSHQGKGSSIRIEVLYYTHIFHGVKRRDEGLRCAVYKRISSYFTGIKVYI